jgi:hypothetical protein
MSAVTVPGIAAGLDWVRPFSPVGKVDLLVPHVRIPFSTISPENS